MGNKGGNLRNQVRICGIQEINVRMQGNGVGMQRMRIELRGILGKNVDYGEKMRHNNEWVGVKTTGSVFA